MPLAPAAAPVVVVDRRRTDSAEDSGEQDEHVSSTLVEEEEGLLLVLTLLLPEDAVSGGDGSLSMVVRFPLNNGPRPVDLLQKHQSRDLVIHHHRRQPDRHIRALAYLQHAVPISRHAFSEELHVCAPAVALPAASTDCPGHVAISRQWGSTPEARGRMARR